MKITAITQFKQGDLWMALKKLGWNQSELARRCKCCPSTIGAILNMKRKPSQKLASKIQRILSQQGIFLDVLSVWPDGFAGTGKRVVLEETREIPNERLLADNSPLMLQERTVSDINEYLKPHIRQLTERERAIIRMRFLEGRTLAEIAKRLSVGPPRIGHIERKALQKIRRSIGEESESDQTILFDRLPFQSV